MKRTLKILLPILVLALGIMAARGILATRQGPERSVRQQQSLPVTVAQPQLTDIQRQIRASGTLEPARTLVVSSQIAGRLEFLHPAFRAGGRIDTGETIFRIDDRDARIALEQTRADLARVQLELEQVQSERQSALAEWEQYRSQNPQAPAPSPLALHEPQLASAQAALRKSEAQVRKAQIDLERTSFRAPFAALVLDISAEPGQFVGVGTTIGTLAARSAAEVRIPLSLAERQLIRVPGAAMQIERQVNGIPMEYRGRILRSLGAQTSASRTSQVVGRVPRPLDPADTRALPLEFGSYVDVRIDGGTLSDVWRIPRALVRENRIWLADSGDRLQPLDIEPVWKTADWIYLDRDIDSQSRIVSSPLNAPVAGTQVRILPSTSGDEQP